jgi:hypothetical protein
VTSQLASASLVLVAVPNGATVVRMVVVGPLCREAQARAAVVSRRLSSRVFSIQALPVRRVNHRLLEPIGYIPPAEAEANYYRQLAGQTAAVAA